MRSTVVEIPGAFRSRRFLAFAFAALFLAVFALPDLRAGGRRTDTVVAEGEETWLNVFDVREYRTGTHNFIVHARDRAGNVSVSGAYNIRVDPNAALSTVRIVHPADGVVIRQNINVVGVAAGRYGVERVFLRLNDDDEIVVNGTEYWDSFLDFSGLPDGRHSLGVWALDEGGLYGPETRVDFVLDRSPPAFELVSHEIGDIISGNVTVSGRVSDVSGIRHLHISDDGIIFRPLPMRTRRGEDPEFSFSIRTGNFPDGSIVYHLRAVDNTGLVTVYPVMFFISNTPPELEILSPLDFEYQFHSFLFSGRAHSAVGIDRVFFQWGRGRGEIPVRPGDPYWHVVLDQTFGSGNVITVTAVDNAGNAVTASRRLDNRSRETVPAIVIDYPPPEVLANMPPGTSIYGRVLWGIGEVAVQIGHETVNAYPAFRIGPGEIPVGRNVNFRFFPVDSLGVRGPVTTLRVTSQLGPLDEAPVLVPTRDVTVISPARGGWVSGGSVLLEGRALPGSRVQFRFAPGESWRNLELDEYGGFSRRETLGGREPGPVHLEFRTGTDFPMFHPFNLTPTAAPQMRWITPSIEGDPHLPPRLVRGNRTVIGELRHPVPVVSVAVAHSPETADTEDGNGEAGGFTEIPFASCGDRIWFTYFCDFTALLAEDGTLIFRITDATGALFVAAPNYSPDPNPPIPIIMVNSPVHNEVFTTGFEISGIAFDDVGIRGVYWRFLGPALESISPGPAGDAARAAAEAFAEDPDPEFAFYLTERTFGIPIDFTMITDGEYTLEIFAADIYGVRSELISRTVRVSTAPPDTVILYPLITHYNNRTVTVRGFSKDANGIAEVLFSMDGGNTWQDVDLAEDDYWEISLNTEFYTDGINSALIQTVDNYGIASFTIAMINIDNSPPELYLSSPANGQNVGGYLEFMGRVSDNMGLYTLTFQIIGAENPDYRISRETRPSGSVIFETVSLRDFAPGDYIVRVVAVDLAGNETIVSREITLGGGDAEIAIFNPFPGETLSGPVSVAGTVTGEYMPDRVVLMMNAGPIAVVPVDRFGIFTYELPADVLRDGQAHAISVYFDMIETGQRISSPIHTVFYSGHGPILTVDSHRDGDVITARPWLSGRAWISAEDDPEADRAERRALAGQRALGSVQVSFDNGRTFRYARGGRGNSDWRFRLETGELTAGYLPILVRARFANGEQAVRRVMLYVDTTPPFIHTITPFEGTAHRDSVLIYGIAGDNNSLAGVDISLRTLGKWRYSVPGILRGAYFDFKFLGATYFEVGFGLSFFDDNVRLQTQFGLAPSDRQQGIVYGGRYTGMVLGVRLLANIFSLPFSWMFGPDWAFYSMNLAVGANFSWFEMGERNPVLMTSVLAQWDVANVNMQKLFPNWNRFRNFALYVQPELWFATTDVQTRPGAELVIPSTIFRMTFGLRVNLF